MAKAGSIEMITKIAISLAQAAAIGASGGLGDYKAHQLTSDQKKMLGHHYALEPSANLKMRNTGRGVAGYILGEIPGAIAGGLVSGGNPVVAALGALGTGALGAHLMTNKYSPKAAEALAEKYRKAKV